MVRIRAALALLCVLLCAVPLSAAADGSRSGKIEEARERMRENASSSDRGGDRDDDDDDDDEDDDDSGHGDSDGYGDSLLDDDDEDDELGAAETIAGQIVLYMLIYPFWAPAAIIDDWSPLRQYGFQSYPYQAGAEGHLRVLPLDERGRATVPDPHELSLRLLASYERHAENLDGRRLRLTLHSNTRVGLEASITRYTEALGAGEYDALWHYSALATYAFAVSPRTQFTAGVGARGFRFSAGDQFTHVAFHYGGDFFPVRPVHFWLLGQAGFGPSGSSNELEAGLGVLLHRFEVFGGYRRFRIVGVDFSGPELGLAAWF
jgi:hypothetical protein